MYSVILILLLTTINTGDGEFVKCIAQCIELKDCEEVQLLHKEKGITPKICGFNGTEPKVCCSENDEKTLITFHYGGLRKAEKKCKEFEPLKIYRRKDEGDYEYRYSTILPPFPVRDGFRYMAALGYGNLENTIYRCGGFLIEKNVVITAAHCTELNGEPPSHVLIGSYSTSPDEKKSIRVGKIIPHPNYDNKTYLNDIAIIILAEDSTQRPACLLTQRLNLRHDNRTIAVGFGQTSFGGPFAEELNQVYMNIINKRACENEYNTQLITDSQLCVLGETRYYENGTSIVSDTCQGDSGGPLVLHRKNDYVVGIVSNGRFCGSEAPGIYTYIASYTGWIKTTILKEADGKELQECDELEPPYRTLSTCDQDGPTGIACNVMAYIGDRAKYKRPGYAFMVSLGYGNIKNPEYKCDGFFIDYNVVITAAQCAEINGELPLVVRTTSYEHHLTGVETQLIKVAKVIPHPNYQSQTYLNDIAILFLVEKSNSLTREYSCLFTSSLNFTSVNQAFAYSYGRTSFDGHLSNDFFVVPMDISNKSICEEQFKIKPLANSQLCGLTHFDYVGEDTYQGNSGGPIVLNNVFGRDLTYYASREKVKKPWYVIGIISYGQGPGVFTNITSYLDWIESIVWSMGTEEERRYIA